MNCDSEAKSGQLPDCSPWRERLHSASPGGFREMHEDGLRRMYRRESEHTALHPAPSPVDQGDFPAEKRGIEMPGRVEIVAVVARQRVAFRVLGLS